MRADSAVKCVHGMMRCLVDVTFSDGASKNKSVYMYVYSQMLH